MPDNQSNQVASPLVSVIIPMYNAALYIQETLETVAQQTYSNIEIIVIDNESTDSSLKIVEQFSGPFPVQILRQSRRGPAAARNAGLRMAHGLYIQFLDADDLLSPEKIALQVSYLTLHPGELPFCPGEYFAEGQSPFTIPLPREESIFADLLSGKCVLPIHALLIPRSILPSDHVFSETLLAYEDWSCWIALALQGVHFHRTNTGKVFYRLRKNSLTSDTEKMYVSLLAAINLLISSTTDQSALRQFRRRQIEVHLLRLQLFARRGEWRSYRSDLPILRKSWLSSPFGSLKTICFGIFGWLTGGKLWPALDSLHTRIIRQAGPDDRYRR